MHAEIDAYDKMNKIANIRPLSPLWRSFDVQLTSYKSKYGSGAVLRFQSTDASIASTTSSSVTKTRDKLERQKSQSTAVDIKKDGALLLRKPIPPNFIKETFLPHLEHSVAYNITKFPPAVVLEIGIAYSKLPVFIRQRAVEDALVEAFRLRMVDYTASDCVQLLNTAFQLQGLRTVKIYDDIVNRLKSKAVTSSISPLNRLGICRSVSRILSRAHQLQGEDDGQCKDFVAREFALLDTYKTSWLKPWSILTKSLKDSKINKFVHRIVDYASEAVLPQLEYELAQFDSNELCDLLTVMAQRSERDGVSSDFPVVAVIMSHVMSRYDYTALATNMANFYNLSCLRMHHPGFSERIVADIKNPLKMNNIYSTHLARTVWALAKFDLLAENLDHLMPHLQSNIPKFDAASFARLAQLTSHLNSKEYNVVVEKTLLCCHSKVHQFDVKQLLFYVNGCCFTNTLPKEEAFIAYLQKCKDGFKGGPKKQGRVFKPTFAKGEKYLLSSQKSASDVDVLVGILSRLQDLEQDMDLIEINRLVKFVKSTNDYSYTCQYFPESWSIILKDFRDPLEI